MTTKEKIAHYSQLQYECKNHDEMVQKVIHLNLSLADAMTVFMFVFKVDVATAKKLLFSRPEYAGEAKFSNELTDNFFDQLNT